MSAEPIRLFVFGLGYSSTAFARALKARAAWIGGTVRTAERAALLKSEGFETFIFDGSPSATVRPALAAATHVLVSIAPGDAGDPVLAHHRADLLAAGNLRWIGYLSTVGVYGNYGGAWVSERTTPHPTRGRSAVRLDAEKAWLALGAERAAPTGIFRLAGIYGPGRNAFVNLAEGKAHRVIKPGQVFNRVDVGDIAATLMAAAERSVGGVYNISDDEPGPPEAVITYAAALMGLPPPPEEPFDRADLSPMARSFYADNKRVDNRRIKDTLGVALRHPTYRDGLDALWRDGNWRG